LAGTGKGDPLEVSDFGGDPDARVDFGSLFHFLHHCGIEDFWTFVSIQPYANNANISHTINGRYVS